MAESATPYQKIDCHSHFIPPDYRKALQDHGHTNPDGMPNIPPWSEEEHLEFMQSTNIVRSIISISSPGTHLVAGDDYLARNIASSCNDYAADLKRRRPDQFGFFASLPLPDVKGSLDEIHRVSDQLNCDGFVLETNHHGIYLGDSRFDCIFDELNKKKAVVFIHPTTPCVLVDGKATPATPLAHIPRPMFEFLFDSARAVINLFVSGTISRCPNITFIIAHMGGALPPMIRRFATMSSLLSSPGVDTNLNPEWVQQRLNQQFFFDSAGWAFPEQIHDLLEHVSVDRLVYGSDYCWTPADIAKGLSEEHDKYLPRTFSDPHDRAKLCLKNAEALFAG